jgi:uncharacterized protein DUF3180
MTSQRPGPMAPQDEQPEPSGQPRLRPTSAATLVVAALVTAALTWMAISHFYGQIPDLNWLPGLTLAGLAVLEGIAARNTKARIDRRPRAGPVNPLLVARFVVLAKASSLAGAIFAGAYGGVAAWALAERDRLRVAATDLVPASAGLVGSLALVAAALLLERACRVPEPPDDHPGGGGGGPPGPRR